MCFHISQTKIGRELMERFKARPHLPEQSGEDLPGFYHISGFSHPNITIIPQEEPSVLTIARWGIVPSTQSEKELNSYYKKAAAFGGGLNAQSEKVFNHFIYKHSIFTKKCLIPVTGFFEPHEFQGKKFPYYICRKDRDVLVLAGIYSQTGTTLTCSILTREASPMFAEIHNQKKRQPVILAPEYETKWLEDKLDETDILSLINSPYPEEELSIFSVSKDVFNSRKNSDIPEILLPVEYPELNRLF